MVLVAAAAVWMRTTCELALQPTDTFAQMTNWNRRARAKKDVCEIPMNRIVETKYTVPMGGLSLMVGGAEVLSRNANSV